MSFQEKNLFASLTALLILMAIFFPKVSTMYQSGRFEGEAGLILLGKTGLVFVGAGIVTVVVTIILYSVLFAVLTGERKTDSLVDERDRLIERRGMQISGSVTGIGFVASMAALMLGYAAVPVFFIIALSFMAGEFVSGLARIAMYRLGW